MITSIFSSYFYDIIEPLNKDELLFMGENPPLDKDQRFNWGEDCGIKLERLLSKEFERLIYPTLSQFQKKFNRTRKYNIGEVWKTTYNKGSFQEMHDHAGCEISGVLFLDDKEENGSKFYFYNRHSSELTLTWLEILSSPLNHYIDYKRGDVLFFPSYMLHGVTCHRSNKKRRTVAFNFI